MVDIFIDPADTAPVQKPTRYYPKPNNAEKNDKTESFEKVLSKQVNQQDPTPVLTPDNIKPSNPVQPTPRPTLPKNTTPVKTDSVSTESPKLEPSSSANITSKQEPKSLQEVLNQQKINNAPEKSPTLETKTQEAEKPSPPVNSPMSTQEQAPRFDNVAHIVQVGDTLSEIVANALKQQGVNYSTSELYRMVDTVAVSNGIQNPNLIYPGQRIDLTPLGDDVSPQNESNANFMANLSGLQPPVRGRITSHFGMRNHPILDGERFHTGVDIGVQEGTPVRPIKSGEVTFAGEKGGYGLMVEVDHGEGVKSRYGHLSELMVNKGDPVDANFPLAFSGQTGLATGPHLHLEIHQNNRAVDPLTVIPAESFEADDDSQTIARGNNTSSDI